MHASHASTKSERPHTTDDAANHGIRQLLELRVGQHVELQFAEVSDTPDFHEDDSVYRVTETIVKHSPNAEESYFSIHLGSDSVHSLDDPVFQISLSRSVSRKLGLIKENPKWDRSSIQHRTGTNPNGTYKWGGLTQYYFEGVTVVADTERCSECGHPV